MAYGVLRQDLVQFPQNCHCELRFIGAWGSTQAILSATRLLPLLSLGQAYFTPRNDKNVFSYVGGGFIRPGLFGYFF